MSAGWREDLAQQIADLDRLSGFGDQAEVSVEVCYSVVAADPVLSKARLRLRDTVNGAPFCGAGAATLRFVSECQIPAVDGTVELTLMFAYRPSRYHCDDKAAATRIYPEADFDDLG